MTGIGFTSDDIYIDDYSKVINDIKRIGEAKCKSDINMYDKYRIIEDNCNILMYDDDDDDIYIYNKMTKIYYSWRWIIYDNKYNINPALKDRLSIHNTMHVYSLKNTIKGNYRVNIGLRPTPAHIHNDIWKYNLLLSPNGHIIKYSETN